MTTIQAFIITQDLLETQYDKIKAKRYGNMSKKNIEKIYQEIWTQGYTESRLGIRYRTRIETEEVMKNKKKKNQKPTGLKVTSGEHKRIHFDELYYDRGYGSMATLNQKIVEINKYDNIGVGVGSLLEETNLCEDVIGEIMSYL
jgi:hypothetical protein